MDSNVKSVFDNYKLYSDLTDEEVVELIQSNDAYAEEYIFLRYYQTLKGIVSKYYIVGAEKEDLLQEAMLGLYSAVNDYNSSKHCTFKSYACICVKRQIISFIRTSKRQKNNPLYNYLSFNEIVYEDNELNLLDKLTSNSCESPENIVMEKENKKTISNMIDKYLSDFEKQVLFYYREGLSYEEISNIMKKDIKSIDNALQRIKKKFKKDNYS